MALVPAPVIVNVPIIAGVFKASPSHAAILTPGVIVTDSDTESLKNMVSPATASAMQLANVV